jgi:hypothetical protein
MSNPAPASVSPSAVGAAVDPVSPRDVAGLPAPVAAYLEHAIPRGTIPPAALVLEQTGEMLLGQWWRPFSARERLQPPPAGLLWEASVRLAPFVKARVRDGYEAGVGSMRATVAGVSLASVRDTPALNAGALHRYLAECVWLPTALLPRYAVIWSPIDDSRACATLADAGNQVSLEFTFTPRGEVAEVFTPARARAVRGAFELTAWRVEMTRHGERCGLWMPGEAEVCWQIDGVWEPCWRGRLGRVSARKGQAGA